MSLIAEGKQKPEINVPLSNKEADKITVGKKPDIP